MTRRRASAGDCGHDGNVAAATAHGIVHPKRYSIARLGRAGGKRGRQNEGNKALR